MRDIIPAINIDFHFERYSSSPWYKIIYPAPIVIMRSEIIQRAIMSFCIKVQSTVLIVAFELSHFRPFPPSEKSEVSIIKLALSIQSPDSAQALPSAFFASSRNHSYVLRSFSKFFIVSIVSCVGGQSSNFFFAASRFFSMAEIPLS